MDKMAPPATGKLSTLYPTVKPGHAVRVALVGCGKAKRAGKHRVRHLYIGPLFTAALKHATHTADEVFVVSAFHGLLALDAVVESYDRALTSLPKRERDAWATRVARDLFWRMRGWQFEVDIFAGRTYADPLWTALRLMNRSLVIGTPLAGLSIGYQLQWLRSTVDYAEAAHVAA